jgi:mercuric ion transport protein
MTADRCLRVGIVGAIITALCCFTPVLAVLLGALGLAAWVGRLDLVLLPALALSLVLIGYSLWTRRCSSQLRPRP